MDYCKSILICGGDKRQKYLYRQMLADGLNVSTLALGDENSADLNNIGNFDVVIFPVPVSKDGTSLNSPLVDYNINLDDIFSRLKKTQTILGGMCDGINYDMLDYYKSETLQMQNAIPTAEGAIRIAMENCNFTLYGSKCLITGYGRIGKILAKRLRDMGAEVTICARKESAITLAAAMGCNSIHLSYIADCADKADIIFNTVPYTIITSEVLGKIQKDTLIIELASKPYGVDTDAAEALGRNVIIASGLPGKFTPESSAKILKEVIIKFLMEMEV